MVDPSDAHVLGGSRDAAAEGLLGPERYRRLPWPNCSGVGPWRAGGSFEDEGRHSAAGKGMPPEYGHAAS